MWVYDDEYAYQITSSKEGEYKKAVVHRNRTPIAVADNYFGEYRIEFLMQVSDMEDVFMRTKRQLC